MSRADHDEPLRWHWLYIPLVAYLVFSIAPSILAPIFFVLTLFVIDVPMQPAPTPVSLVAFPLFLGLIFWPFLWMYRYARNALIEHPSSEKSLRLATIMSVAAMSLPCSMLSLMASAGGGQGQALSPSLPHFVAASGSWDGSSAGVSRGSWGPDRGSMAAHRKLKNDPEGVAFEYDVIETD